jgi:hypothetical protein
MAGIGAGRLLGIIAHYAGCFLPPPIPHHVGGHLKKLHLKMRGVFLPPPIPTTSAGIRKNRVAKIEKMLVNKG